MSLTLVSDQDRDVIHQCLIAMRSSGALDPEELRARLGISAATYDSLLARWPDLDVSRNEDARLLIHNVLNEVCNGVNFEAREWAQWFDVPQSEVRAVFDRWRDLTILHQ